VLYIVVFRYAFGFSESLKLKKIVFSLIGMISLSIISIDKIHKEFKYEIDHKK